MLEFMALPVAVILGFLAGLGVGGGSLLMLWLTIAVGMEYTNARIINLLFFLPTAVISTLFRHREGSVNLKKILPAIILGCVTAVAFSYIGQQVDTQYLKKLFGGLLIFTGIRELFSKPKKPS